MSHRLKRFGFQEELFGWKPRVTPCQRRDLEAGAGSMSRPNHSATSNVEPFGVPEENPRSPDEGLLPVDHEDLQEMLREQERVIDHQIRALTEQDGKSEHMIKLCVAALAGGVALATVLLRDPATVSPRSILPIGLAAGLNLTSLVVFVDAYVGFRHHSEGHIGPDTAWIARKAQDADWTLEEHLLALLTDHPTYSEHNLGCRTHFA